MDDNSILNKIIDIKNKGIIYMYKLLTRSDINFNYKRHNILKLVDVVEY